MSENRKARRQRMGISLSKSELPSTTSRSPGRKSASTSAANTPTKIRARQLAVLQARHGASPTARRACASVAATAAVAPSVSASSSPPAPASATGPSKTHDVRANPVLASTSADSAMARGQLDGVASFKGLLAKGTQASDEAEAAKVKTKKTKTDKPFDPRANNDDSSSEDDDDENSDDSDDDKPPTSDLASRLKKSVNKSPAASARNGLSPAHRSPRAKEDEVADSDNERDSSKAKKVAVKAEPDTTSSEADSDDDEKAASSSSDSSSAAESSDSDAEKSDTDAKKVVKSLLNKPKKAAAAASTSSDPESSDEEVLATQEQDSDAASDKDEKSSDSESDSDDAPAAALTPSRKASKGAQPTSQIFAGMAMRRVDDSVSLKDLSTFLAKAKHKGQQAWVFSIPQATTVKVVEKLDVPPEMRLATDSGSSKLKRKANTDAAAGASYKIILSNRPADRQPNIPETQILRIQHKYDLSGIATAPPLAGLPPRQQPKGMHPRFRPLGVAPDEPMGDIGPSDDEKQEDVEMTQAPPIAKKSKSEKKSKKRQDAEAAAPAIASKKATKRKHQADDVDLASSQQAPEETSQKKAKKAKKQKQEDDATPLRKTTPILPPSVPVSSQKRRASEADPEAATPAPKSSKKNVSFSGLAARAAKESPVPVPYAGSRTAVPLPTIPSSSAPAAETPKASKKDKKKRSSDVVPSSQTAVPTPKETPVPAPTFKVSKSKK